MSRDELELDELLSRDELELDELSDVMSENSTSWVTSWVRTRRVEWRRVRTGRVEWRDELELDELSPRDELELDELSDMMS